MARGKRGEARPRKGRRATEEIEQEELLLLPREIRYLGRWFSLLLGNWGVIIIGKERRPGLDTGAHTQQKAGAGVDDPYYKGRPEVNVVRRAGWRRCL